jgi:peptidoglycan-N-acetylglucosamine deacetylase
MRGKPTAYLTISVDDGHETDLRTAELLARLGLRATFYVPGRNPERPVMRPAEIRELSREFEIGAHTMNHRRLDQLTDVEVRAEVADGKNWLEDILSSEVTSFCYPGGKYNKRTRDVVAKLGFLGARTCLMNVHTAPSDPFQWGVSTQAYSHSWSTHLGQRLFRNNIRGITNYVAVAKLAQDWGTHFRNTLDWVECNGGIAHLYMHSWETNNLREWSKLERALSDAAARSALIRVSNGDLFARLGSGVICEGVRAQASSS